mgnify:CR=1 FL=1
MYSTEGQVTVTTDSATGKVTTKNGAVALGDNLSGNKASDIKIDELRFSDKALTKDQVQTLYEQTNHAQ